MAIGFNLPGIPGQIRGTPEEAGAVPDLGQAMMQGFRSNVENVQGYPRLLAQQLVSNQLANTINRAKAKYAEPIAETDYQKSLMELKYMPQEKQMALGMQGLQQQLLKKQLEKSALDAQMRRNFADMIIGKQPTYPANLQPVFQQPQMQQENPIVKAQEEFQGLPYKLPEQQAQKQQINLPQQIQQGIESPNQKILNPGNPQFYNIDAAYDSNPLFHKYFKEMGLTKNIKIATNPKTNEAVIQTIHPSGKITIEAVPIGKTPGDVRFEEETAKSRAKFLDESAPSIIALESSQENLDNISNLLNEKAESINAVGRMNKPFVELFGSQEQQDILGTLKTQTGTVLMDAAKNIKGAFTGRDMNFINDMKPNATDPYYMFVAKAASMQALNKMALGRLNLITELVQNGMTPVNAAKIAAKKVSLEPLMKQYHEQLKSAKQRTTSLAKATPEQNAYVKSLSDEELMSMINQ
jgi:hypothetical protein